MDPPQFKLTMPSYRWLERSGLTTEGSPDWNVAGATCLMGLTVIEAAGGAATVGVSSACAICGSSAWLALSVGVADETRGGLGEIGRARVSSGIGLGLGFGSASSPVRG
jgi:hypothetical protein